jgi:hypothetical protein
MPYLKHPYAVTTSGPLLTSSFPDYDHRKQFMVMTSTKTAEPVGHSQDVMGRQMHLEPPRPSPAPADSHGPDQVPGPPTAPAYYLERPAWVWIAAFRRATLHTKAKA